MRQTKNVVNVSILQVILLNFVFIYVYFNFPKKNVYLISPFIFYNKLVILIRVLFEKKYTWQVFELVHVSFFV